MSVAVLPSAVQQPSPSQVHQVTLAEAIDFVNGREGSSHLIAVETFFLKRLMEDLDTEEKAECYYYLLRCRLKKSRLFETADQVDLYRKMRRTFKEAEMERLSEARTSPGPITHAQLHAFYRLAIFYFSSLENVYHAQNFDDSARRAYEDKMDFRKHAYRAEKRWGRFLGYWIIDATSRYGNSFFRWGITTLFSILAFVSVYSSIDAATAVQDRLIPQGESFLDYFYFTIVTYTTLGYGDFHPHTPPQMIAAVANVLTGYFMLGIFINLMNRKL